MRRRPLSSSPSSLGRSRAAACALVAGAFAIAAPRSARAADGDVEVHEFDASGEDRATADRPRGVVYFNPGPIVSLVGGRAPATGYGLEGSAMYYARGQWNAPGVGGFAQAQLYDGKYTRLALGGQACLANLGVELGLAYRAAQAGYVDTVSVHGAIFVSAAFLVIALRDTIPLNGWGLVDQGFGPEVAFTVAVKLPIMIWGHDKTGLSVF